MTSGEIMPSGPEPSATPIDRDSLVPAQGWSLQQTMVTATSKKIKR